MRILHLLYESKGDYFGIGGVGTRAYEIYKYLKNRHDITLLCKKYPGAKNNDIEGLRHIFVGTENRSFTKTLLSYAYHASNFVKKYGTEFDVIIEEFSPAIPTFLSFYKKRPLILQIQGHTGRKYFGKYNILFSLALYTYEKISPRFYKCLIFLTEESRNRYKLSEKSNIRIIHSGISEKLLDIEPSESDYIAYLGRIDIHHKGLDILVDSYKEFYKAFPDVKLVIGGDGRDKNKFSEILKKLSGNIIQNIEMVGWVEGESKLRLLSNAIFAVIPSRYETQCIAAYEAMACGKALVVSDIPELSYVTDNRAGISFKSEDAVSLAQAMKEMATSGIRREMGRRGRDWVKDFTWDKIALKFEDFLKQVANKHP